MKWISKAIVTFAFTLIAISGCSNSHDESSPPSSTLRDGVDLQMRDGRRVIPFEDVIAVQLTTLKPNSNDDERSRSTRTYMGTNLQPLLEMMGLRKPIAERAIATTNRTGEVRLTFKTKDGSAAEKTYEIFDNRFLIDREFPEVSYEVHSREVLQ